MNKKYISIDELDSYANKICSDVAKQISEELTETAYNSLLDFYSSYDPKYYMRHENFIRKYRPQKYYHNQSGKIFRGGVKLLVDKIPDVYQDPSPTVANFVYNGLHGWASVGLNGVAPIMKPSPLELVNMKKKDIEKNIQKYIDNVNRLKR